MTWGLENNLERDNILAGSWVMLGGETTSDQAKEKC